MSATWINPKIIIGNTATGKYYFPRPQIEADIWDEISKGNHVLLAAPRRVGKTSVMLAMLENCPEETHCIFKNIQGVKSETEFYQQFFQLIVQCLNKFQKGKKWIADLFAHLTIEEITLDGLKFGEKKPTDFVEEIHKILPKIKQHGLKVVLLLDELPEVLNNLHKNGKKIEASNILDRLRQWRQNPEIRGHFSLVLAGSVGIHHVVKNIEGRTSDLNDFGIVLFEALNRGEAGKYIAWATQGATVQYDESLTNHLLGKINHFIPYFMNLVLDEVNKAARNASNPSITFHNIDVAFDKVVKASDHFKEWKNRLFDYFTGTESAFLNEVLIFIAHNNYINPQELYDLAMKHQLGNTYMELIRGLEHDGYVTEQGARFVFVSPFLQSYWKQDHPVSIQIK